MRKLLLLGGSAQQVVAIRTARRLGLGTVLCDYLPDNPGQREADRFHLVSTTDKEAVLAVAREEKVDGVLAYASDPAAPTAAYVAERMGLPGNPYEAVEILCNKDRFRSFLKANGFNTPVAKGYSDAEMALRDLRSGFFDFPVVVKPVDSSGSKGVVLANSVAEASVKIGGAMSFSRSRRILIEEFVDKFGYQVAGDGFSIDGKLVFRCFANDHFDPHAANPFVPVAASFPYNMPESVQDRIHAEIQRALSLLGMRTSSYNFDLRIDSDLNVHLMEIGPRSGGNYIPQIIKLATGVDLVECSVKAAIGEKVDIPIDRKAEGFHSYYALHSSKGGILKRIRIKESARRRIVEDHTIKFPGDEVAPFTGSNTTLGILVMRFDSMGQMLDMMDHSEKWVEIELEEGGENGQTGSGVGLS